MWLWVVRNLQPIEMTGRMENGSILGTGRMESGSILGTGRMESGNILGTGRMESGRDWSYGEKKHSSNLSEKKHSWDWSYGEKKHSLDWSYGEKEHSLDWSYGEKEHSWDWSFGEKKHSWSYGKWTHSWDWSYGDDWSTCSHEQDDDYELIEEENPEETKEILRREELIKTTKKILQQHCSGAVRQHHRGESVLKSLKRPRRHRLKTSRTRRSRKTASKRAKVRDAKLDDKSSSINIEKLRYSQAGCSNVFQCGRTVRELVLDLLSGKVKLSAPFLRLTVFETTESTDEKTHQRIFRCIDNRRLLALKTYATYSGKANMMVRVRLHDHHTVHDFERFAQNSDPTAGFHVKVRNKYNKKAKKDEKNVANKRWRQLWFKVRSPFFERRNRKAMAWGCSGSPVPCCTVWLVAPYGKNMRAVCLMDVGVWVWDPFCSRHFAVINLYFNVSCSLRCSLR